MGSEAVRQIPIEEEMQQSYLTYAMSVIVARALPDVRDGLKPVHRRILYAMYDMGLTPAKPYKKSARIVGEVLGKYHPHGDAAVYDAMVRMAQEFSLRYPLVDGQGNFGSIDGDNAAAMRYTEARLSPIAIEMLRDIEEETVDFVPNFDGTLQEPAVLPGAFPNLIVNGASGIAVGMSTNIPPHNLAEVVTALTYLIDNWARLDEVTTSDIMTYLPGPDFPTGGLIYRYAEEKGETVDRIARFYATGKGHFVVQAKVHVEEMGRNRQRLVVTEIPYQTSKTRLIERIADLVRDGRVEGISDVRDESDRTGMRLVIELQRNVAPEDVLPSLYKLTPMRQTFGAQMLALVDGEPRVLPLKRLLTLFIQHRQDVIRRRSEFRLEKARYRAHVLEGLLKALGDLDVVVNIIRRSRTTETARQNLIKRLKVTQIQAQAILDMPLKRLAQLERRALQDEYKELRKAIAYLEDLLAHPAKMLNVIREELQDIRERFGDARRTQIVDVSRTALTAQEYMPTQPVAIVVTRAKEVMVLPLSNRRRGTVPGRRREAPRVAVTATSRDMLYIFNESGWVARLPVHQLPSDPVPLSSLVQLESPIAALLALPTRSQGGMLVLATAGGRVKRIAIDDLIEAAHKPVQCMAVEKGDRLVAVLQAPAPGDILLFTRKAQAIRFADEEVRRMGLSAAGVFGIKLTAEDWVVRAAWAQGEGEVWALTTAGYGKRMDLADFPRQKRYGSGVVLLRLTRRHGEIADVRLVHGKEEVFAVTDKGYVSYVRAADIPSGKRGTAPRPVLTLKSQDKIDHMILLAPVETEQPPAKSRRKNRRGRLNKASASAIPGSTNKSTRAREEKKERKRSHPQEKESPPQSPKTSTGKQARKSAQPGEAVVRAKKSRKVTSRSSRASAKKKRSLPKSVS